MAEQSLGKTECVICASYRKITYFISCPKCKFTSCKTCVMNFLLSVPDIIPRCMNPECKCTWAFDFVAENTDENFHNKVYRQYRANIVLERERSLLPGTQEVAQEEREKQKRKALIRANKEKISKLEQKLRSLRSQVRILEALNRGEVLEEYSEEKEPSKNIKFIGHCPYENCNGYLKEDYICGLCNNTACRRCRKVKHEEKCNKDDVETVKFMSKDVKGCPTCSVPIHKIDGCDQMWCPSCHTAFDWKTGRIEINNIHNPHYYEWQRRMNNGTAPRAIGDNPCDYGNNLWEEMGIWFQRYNLYKTDLEHTLTNIFMRTNEIRDYTLEKYPNEIVGMQNYQDLRVRYLLNDLSEKQWGIILKAREKRREKNRDIHLIIEMYCNVINDIFANAIRYPPQEVNILEQIENIRLYANDNLKKVGARLKNKVPEINESYTIADTRRRNVRAILNHNEDFIEDEEPEQDE
jgi:hypothetical protein